MLGLMQVRVLFFGVLREMVGEAERLVAVPAGASAEDLIASLRERTSKESDLWTRLAVAVNREYAARTTVLADGDEVALLPPVSGGR